MTRHHRRTLLLGAGLTLGLGGCTGLLAARNAPPPAVYRLTPKVTLPADLPRRDWVLIVAEPTAEGALDSSRIAIQTDGRVDRLADVAWADRPAAMLQSAIVQAFQASGKLRAAGSDREDLPGRYLLQLAINAFQLEPEGDGYAADVRFHGRLLALPGREIAGGQDFAARMPAGARTDAAAVAAFHAALSGLLAELVAWTLRTGKPR